TMSNERNPFSSTGMPPDEKLQAAVGRVAIRHWRLDRVLRLALRSIDDITAEEAWSRTARMTSGLLCQCVRRAPQAAFGDNDAFKQLDALLVAAAGATEEENGLMQALCATGEDGGPPLRSRAGRREPVPGVPQLDSIADRLDLVAEQLSYARRHGFLK